MPSGTKVLWMQLRYGLKEVCGLEKINLIIMKPFEDWKKLSIGAALMMVPGVNLITGIFVYGYLLTYAHNSLRSRSKLPEWGKFGELFSKGISGVFVNLLLALPVIILLSLLILSLGYKLNPECLIGACDKMVEFAAPEGVVDSLMVFSVLATLLVLSVSPFIQLRFSKSFSVTEAFSWDMFGVVFRKEYFATFVKALGIMAVISFVSWLAADFLGFTYVLPFVIVSYMQMINQIIYFTIFTDEFRRKV